MQFCQKRCFRKLHATARLRKWLQKGGGFDSLHPLHLKNPKLDPETIRIESLVCEKIFPNLGLKKTRNAQSFAFIFAYFDPMLSSHQAEAITIAPPGWG